MKEKDVTLENLSRRYPEIEKMIKGINFEVKENINSAKNELTKVEPSKKSGETFYKDILKPVVPAIIISVLISYAKKYGLIP